MRKQDLVAKLSRRARIPRAAIETLLEELGRVVVDEALLKADAVRLPNLGAAHAEWHTDNGTRYLYARFDWAPDVAKRIAEAGR